MFDMILKVVEVSAEFGILHKEKQELRLLLVHISPILALTQYAINLSCLCRTHCLTADESECFETILKLRSCPSYSVLPVTEKKRTCFYKVCCRINSLLNILNSLHYYIQTQKVFRGTITGITWPSWLIQVMLVLKEHVSRRLEFWFIWLNLVLTHENMKTWEIDLIDFWQECVTVNIWCLTCWPTDWQGQAQTILIIVLNGPQIWGGRIWHSASWVQFYCLAWAHNRFFFLLVHVYFIS